MAKKQIIEYTTRIGKLPHMINMHYIEVSPAIIKKLGGSMKLRLICTVNGKISFQGGLVALGEGSAYITLNAKRMKELGVKLGSQVSVTLERDESKFGMEVPEELSELLKQDPEGKKRFDMLLPGKQRYIIHYVSTVKSSNLRADRAVLLISNLKKLPIGKENFREMLGLPPR